VKTLIDQTREFIQHHKDICIPMILSPVQDENLVDWIMKESRLPWLELRGLDPPYAEMLAEAGQLRHRFVDHRGENGTGWLSLCIHGISAEHTNSAASYGLTDDTAAFTWTNIEKDCPVTVDFFRNHFHYVKFQRVRFMLLQPGGFIEPHADNDNYHVGGAINISLSNPAGCRLTSTGGTVPFRDSGSMFYFNTSYEHAAFNDSDQDRLHIIVHGQPDMSYWQSIILNSFKDQSHEQS